MYWQVNRAVSTAQEKDELVLLNMTTGKFYGLDPVGSQIWAMLQAPVTAEAIVDALAARYAVERTRLHQDVMALLTDLERQRLVERT